MQAPYGYQLRAEWASLLKSHITLHNHNYSNFYLDTSFTANSANMESEENSLFQNAGE